MEWQERWGGRDVGRRFVPAPEALLRNYAALGMSEGCVLFVLRLLTDGVPDDSGRVAPSFHAMEKTWAIARRCFTRWTTELEGLGLGRRIPQVGGGLLLDLCPLFDALQTAARVQGSAPAPGLSEGEGPVVPGATDVVKRKQFLHSDALSPGRPAVPPPHGGEGPVVPRGTKMDQGDNWSPGGIRSGLAITEEEDASHPSSSSIAQTPLTPQGGKAEGRRQKAQVRTPESGVRSPRSGGNGSRDPVIARGQEALRRWQEQGDTMALEAVQAEAKERLLERSGAFRLVIKRHGEQAWAKDAMAGALRAEVARVAAERADKGEEDVVG